MSATTPTTPPERAATRPSQSFEQLDQRHHIAVGLRKMSNRVFPTHWSFMLGEIALYSFIVLLLSGVYLALYFDPSMQPVTYDGAFDNLRGVSMSRAYESTLQLSFEVRGGLFVLPPIAYYVTYRFCIGLQRSDRAVLEHGIETGIIRRLPHGEFVEIHQPLVGVDGHGRPIPLTYQGAPVPKRMNQLAAGGRPTPGSLLTMDPAEQTAALERARTEEATAEHPHRSDQGNAPDTPAPNSAGSAG
jgi:hypothetical protein